LYPTDLAVYEFTAYILWSICFFVSGVTSDIPPAHIPDEWTYSWCQGKTLIPAIHAYSCFSTSPFLMWQEIRVRIRASYSNVAMFIYDKPWSYSDAVECGEVGA